MQLFCKKCGKQVLAEDMNLEMALAKCRECSSVFSILDSLNEETGSGVTAVKAERLPAPMPKGYQIEEIGSELAITYRWFSAAAFFLLFFCVIWDGLLVVWYFLGISQFAGGGGGGLWPGLFMLLFPLLHVAVGVGLTYAVVCMFLNRTEIRVVGGELSIWHGPVPCPGKCRLPTSDVKQLFVTENIHRGKNGCTYTYDVNAMKQDNTKQKLIGNLRDVQQALFLEQKLEQHLGIAPQHVPGEVPA